MIIRNVKKSQPKSFEITPEHIYQERRHFIKTGVGALAGAMIPVGLSAALDPNFGELKASRFNTDEELTPHRKVTTYNNFYELGTNKSDPHENAEYLKSDPWSIEISGLCENKGKQSIEDLVKPHALEERIYRLRCVEAWSMVIPWVGFPLAELIKRAKPLSSAKYVAMRTIVDKNLPGQSRRVLDWPYREGLRMDEAMHPLAIMAVGLYGKILPNQNGAPMRLVVPWKYGFKSIKSIVAIEFTDKQPSTSWGRSAPSEYGFYSNVNPHVDHPRWSQKKERRIGEFFKRDTLLFNGYQEEVASLYEGMDLKTNF